MAILTGDDQTTLQLVKCEVTKQTSHVASEDKYELVLVLECCMWRIQNLSGNVEGGGGGGGAGGLKAPLPHPMKHINVELNPIAVSYITQK